MRPGSGGRDPRDEETRTGYGEAEEDRRGEDEEVPGGAGGDAGARRGSGEEEGGLDALHPSGGSSGVCELCGGPVVERHCKIVCRNCGYQRDCSDP